MIKEEEHHQQHEIVKKAKLNNNSSACETSDKEGLKILDALSASGLRAIRFALEVPNVEMVIANDFSENAIKSIQRNVELNQVQDKVKPMYSDAMCALVLFFYYE